MKIYKTLFALTALFVSTQIAAAISIGGYEISSQTTTNTNPVACTMDAMLCPDGVTYVGRTGPSCAFAACPTKPVVCIDLKNDLRVGSTDVTTNGEVTKLQSFLFPQYLNVQPTGNLLGLTRAASVSFQKQYGISPAFGYIGALTRAKIKELTCGGVITQTPVINNISPSYAKVGETVVLSGPGLNSGGDYVLFNGWRIQTDGSKALNRVGFVVPQYISQTVNCITAPCPDILTYVNPGTYTVQVVNNLGKTNIINLTVTDGTTVSPSDAPKISWLAPTAGKVGQSVIVYGYNLFRSETRILFDGISIPGKPVYSKIGGDFNSALEFVVPDHLSYQCVRVKPTDPCPAIAARQVLPGTYELAVDNKFGRDAVKFEVTETTFSAKPYISYSTPVQGNIGAEVILVGTNLSTGSEKIYFGNSEVPLLIPSLQDKGDRIRFQVPQYVTPCGYEENTACRMMAQLVTPGKYTIVVKNNYGVSNVISFTVTAAQTNTIPKLNTLTPSAGIVGTDVVIRGEGINTGGDRIYFGNALIPQSNSGSADVVNVLRFKVPQYITPCGVGSDGTCKIASREVIPGAYEVTVVNNQGVSNKLQFNVITYSIENPLITKFQVENVTTANSASRSLVWTTQFASSCTASGAWSGAQPVNGSYSIGFMSQPFTYTLTCVNAQGASVSRSVTEPTPTTTQTPVISFANPSNPSVGTEVVLSGERLNTGSPKIIFGEGFIIPNPTRASDSVLYFTIPSTMSRYCAPGLYCTDNMISVMPGSYPVKVINSYGTSNSVTITVATASKNAPTISFLDPSAGSANNQVTIHGANFNPSSDFVWFGGVKLAPIREMKNLNSLTFTVPNSLYQCTSTYCPDVVPPPTPLGYYDVKVENSSGVQSNTATFQVTGNGSKY